MRDKNETFTLIINDIILIESVNIFLIYQFIATFFRHLFIETNIFNPTTINRLKCEPSRPQCKVLICTKENIIIGPSKCTHISIVLTNQ